METRVNIEKDEDRLEEEVIVLEGYDSDSVARAEAIPRDRFPVKKHPSFHRNVNFDDIQNVAGLEEVYDQLSVDLNQQEEIKPKQDDDVFIFPQDRKKVQEYALEILLEGIKAGRSRHLPLAKLLVNFNAEFAEDEKEIGDLMKENQKEYRLLEHQINIQVMRTNLALLFEAKKIVEAGHGQGLFANVNEFEMRFFDSFKNNAGEIIQGLEKMIEMLQLQPEHYEYYLKLLLKMVNPFLPETLDCVSTSFFKINSIEDIPQFLDTMNQEIARYEKLIENADHYYQHLMGNMPYKDLEAKLMEKKRQYRNDLIEVVSAEKDGISMSGIPVKYRKQLLTHKQQLKKMAGCIDPNYEDAHGSNLALLSLLYENNEIYLFLKNERDVNAQKKDQYGRSASLYEQAMLHKDIQIVIPAQKKLREIGVLAYDQFLRRMRIEISAYMESWEMTDKNRESLRQWSQRNRLVGYFIKAFEIEEIFQDRKIEARRYLSEIDRVLEKKIFKFYDTIKKIYSESKQRVFCGSTLPHIIDHYLREMIKNKDYHDLVDPSDLLEGMNKKLEEDLEKRKQESDQQRRAHRRLMDEQRKETEELKQAMEEQRRDSDRKMEEQKRELQEEQQRAMEEQRRAMEERRQDSDRKMEEQKRELQEEQRRAMEEQKRELQEEQRRAMEKLEQMILKLMADKEQGRKQQDPHYGQGFFSPSNNNIPAYEKEEKKSTL